MDCRDGYGWAGVDKKLMVLVEGRKLKFGWPPRGNYAGSKRLPAAKEEGGTISGSR